MKPKVFLEIGHGGKDPGATGNGLRESDLNLSIGLACNEVLLRHDVDVLLSRTIDENDDINEAIEECNKFSPNLATGIHCNAGGGDGAEIYHTIYTGVGKELADDILEEITKIGQNSRGVKTRTNTSGRDYYAFIRNTNCPAVIVECAFVDNKNDIAIIDTAEEQAKMGVAIAKGILKNLGIKYIEKSLKTKNNAVDNTPESYATDAVKWAIDNGILKGDGNGNYKLHSNISRQDMIVFLYRAMQ